MTIRSSVGKPSSSSSETTTMSIFSPSYVRMWNLNMHLICAIAFCFLIALDRSAFGQPDPPESTTIEGEFIVSVSFIRQTFSFFHPSEYFFLSLFMLIMPVCCRRSFPPSLPPETSKFVREVLFRDVIRITCSLDY